MFDIHHAAYAASPKYHDDNIFTNLPVMRGLKQILRCVQCSGAGERMGACACSVWVWEREDRR
jgi:hypothetical protein